MPAKKTSPFLPGDALLAALATNNRIDIYLLERLPAEAWRADPPGGKGRSVAAIAVHMHNVRLMWLKAIGSPRLPAKLEPDSATVKEVVTALDASHDALAPLIRAALDGDGRIKGFKPDVCSFVGYLIAHDAHHRGQITMLARQTGHAVSQSTMFGLWEWGTR